MRVSLAGFIQCYMFDSREKIQKNYNKMAYGVIMFHHFHMHHILL